MTLYMKTKHMLYNSLCLFVTLLDVAILIKIYVLNKSSNLTFFRFTIFSINFNFDFIRSVFILVTAHLLNNHMLSKTTNGRRCIQNLSLIFFGLKATKCFMSAAATFFTSKILFLKPKSLYTIQHFKKTEVHILVSSNILH